MLLVGMATVKTIINVKFAPSRKFSATSKRMSKGISLTNFLFWYSTKLCNELLQLFDQKKDCIECFQGEYEYRGHDRNSGEYWRVTLSDSIRCCQRKRYRLIGSNMKNYLHLLNFRVVRQLI